MKKHYVGWCVLFCLLLPVAAQAAPLRLLATTFPVWQLLSNVTQNLPDVRLDLMIPAQAGCPHDYALTPQDMRKLTTADILIINGLGMETFLEKSLAKVRANIHIVDSSAGMTDLLPLKDEHEHGHGVNPHLFASPARAAIMVRSIAEQLVALDPPHAAQYRENAAAYARKMENLAEAFADLGKRLANTRIVTQHGIFDYLARDAGLTIAAKVQSHDNQAPAAAEMLRLIKKIRETRAGAIFTEPQYPSKIGKTLSRESGIPAAMLDPVASGPASASATYYENTMRTNLETLEKTLGTR